MTVILDFAAIETREMLHTRLAELLEFPEYYGRNLSALYDLLTERGEETELVLRNRAALGENLGGYGATCLEVLFNAARENPALTVRGES